MKNLTIKGVIQMNNVEHFTKKEDLHKHILRDNALSGYSEKAKNELRKCLTKTKEGVCQRCKR